MNSDLPNVWWIQCKPFSEDKRNSSESEQFQKDCLENNTFGMGWYRKEIDSYSGIEINYEIAMIFKEIVNNKGFTVAQNQYSRINGGDIVLARLNDIYYIGEVSFKPKVSDNQKDSWYHDKLSWYSKVNDWKEIGNTFSIPHHLRGKLSGKKYRSTIAPIDGLSKYTVLSMAGVNCEKKKINKDNFFEAMGYEDLEDLMAQYMCINNKNYIILPSSCKTNTPGIEYMMYNPETSQTIACQTKVDRKIDIAEYANESFREYEKIYIFSGLGYANIDKVSENITIVKNDELYKTLLNNKYFKNIICDYFELE